MSLTCPNCHYEIEVKVAARPARVRRGTKEVSPLTSAALARVFEYMKTIAPVTSTSASLYAGYVQWMADEDRAAGRPEKKVLSQNAFGRALTKNGAERWRSSNERGFIIPEIGSDVRPAKMTAAAEEKRDAELQREFVQPAPPKRDPATVRLPWEGLED